MKVLFPATVLAPYVEAYYVSSNLRQDRPGTQFPAMSTSYLKFSPVSAVVSGQATKPGAAKVDFDDQTGLGVKLRPGAFAALFGIPAHELTDRVIPLDEVLGKMAGELSEQISEAPIPSAQIQFFEKMFTGLAQRSHDKQADILLKYLSNMQVSEAAERLGYSPRHFQRKLHNLVGLSPRLYKRIIRFEKALELIQISSQRGKIDWSAIAIQCGYTDQAHFIRDFHQFAGQTPAVYFSSLQGD